MATESETDFLAEEPESSKIFERDFFKSSKELSRDLIFSESEKSAGGVGRGGDSGKRGEEFKQDELGVVLMIPSILLQEIHKKGNISEILGCLFKSRYEHFFKFVQGRQNQFKHFSH